MEDVLTPYDKEFMRMAMLKHEKTFKEQLYELHRLYQIQKILMKKTERNRVGQQLWNPKNGRSFQRNINHVNGIQEKPRTKLDLEIPVEEDIAESNGNKALDIIDESELELTLSLVPTSTYRRKKPEIRLTSDSGSSDVNRTSSLTHQMKSRKEIISRQETRFGRISDVTLGYQSGSKDLSEVDEQLRQERLSQSPWLFQVLGLNIT